MLQFVIRRLLYSIVVLFAASFLVFTSSPCPAIRSRPALNPGLSEQSIQNIEEPKHLDEPVFVRYGYWVKDAVTNQFGTTLLGDRPILPDLWRVMKNTLQLVIVAELLAILIAVGIGVYSALRQYSAFDYTATTFSFLGLAMPVFWLALMLQVGVVYVYEWTGQRHLPDREPELASTRGRASLLDRPRAPPRAAGHRPDGREHRRVLALHARVDARGRELGLRADGAREGPHREEGDDEARVPQRAHPARHARRPQLRRAARRSDRDRDRLLARRDGPLLHQRAHQNDPYPVMAWLMVTATMIIIFNLIADIAYGYLDPRVRYD